MSDKPHTQSKQGQPSREQQPMTWQVLGRLSKEEYRTLKASTDADVETLLRGTGAEEVRRA